MAKGGARLGAGRKKNGKNSGTVEREMRADQQRARNLGKSGTARLAREILEEFMTFARSYAVKYQPHPRNQEADEAKFKEWAILACTWAKDLARYQSPTYRAIEIAPLQVDEEDDTVVLTTMAEVRAELLKYGVPPDEFARALLGPVIEHEPLKKLKG